MQITTILGSPRLSGNTATILKSFEESALTGNRINRINIKEQSVKGCLGCLACQKKQDVPGCIQKDDADKIFEEIINSDLVIYASPVYVWDFTAQMKSLLDRQCCFVKWENKKNPVSLLKEKKVMLLATCGGDAESNADLIKEIFKREMEYLQCNIIGMYIAPNCTTPSSLGNMPRIIAQEMINDLKIKKFLN